MTAAKMKLKLLCLAVLLGNLLLGMGAMAPARAQDVPVVAAASDLQFALPDVAEAFTRETKREVSAFSRALDGSPDKRGPDALMLLGLEDRDRCEGKPADRRFQTRQSDVTANLACFFCDDRHRKNIAAPKIIHQPGFVIPAKRIDDDPADGLFLS
jgi:hypothetical protein